MERGEKLLERKGESASGTRGGGDRVRGGKKVCAVPVFGGLLVAIHREVRWRGYWEGKEYKNPFPAGKFGFEQSRKETGSLLPFLVEQVVARTVV